MSEMSSILGIHQGRGDSSPNELIERGTALGMVASRAAIPLFIRLVARRSFPVEQDVKHAAHAAHVVDPSVLDACQP